MIDLEVLARELDSMTPRSKLYNLIKVTMQARGHWKNAPRGKAFTAGKDIRRGNRVL